MRVLSDFVRVRKCFKDHLRDEKGKVVIYRPDRDVEQTNFGLICDVGNKCREFTKDSIGYRVLCPEWKRGMFGIGNSEFLIREQVLLDRCGALFGDRIWPIP